ncbi:MAG: bifunctional (p)ppGpp synthetase/guanosine-3',5'-bis(diphosphate) 3'-pyrophosphohydrolase [Candidatus Spechtbacterales bacterium]|nr:bifunctional (p)ppGpp synthetase/guanosine-3',5'-bis(diphosphate) 3'-pyrophosphohydrolase [Candidatus Spechtbacterales bacterium]
MPTVTKNTIDNSLEEIKKAFGAKKDKKLIQRAFDIAREAHGEQARESGEPYIVHPLDAALTLTKMEMDAQTIAAALLHDVVDDTDVTLEEIKKEFGEDIAFLVGGVSKLGKLKYRGAQRHAENLRKMLVAMAEDVRVILIKFADRLHNMKTLGALPKRKQKRIALETLEIYAPIAHRLGLGGMARELEDAAFQYIHPEKYEYVKRESGHRIRDAEKYLKRLSPVLKKELAKENIKPKKIEMRAKHYYSLWRKLEKYDYNWSRVHDLNAVRIIVESVEDCYKTLGVVHNLWRPLPGRIKDYIALPKPNGYQSLHTTVFCLDGKITEIQIRTQKMHENSEYGIAAHWRYKDQKEGEDMAKAYGWIKQLQEWKKDSSPTEEFLNNLKLDVFSDRIFVFTPQGDVIDLPKGATPVDFAYNIHTDIGDKCSGAIVGGKMVTLSHELRNGDVVEIITSKNKTPSRAWLNFVKTRNAKNRIRKWLKEQNREQNIDTGQQAINEGLKSLTGKKWKQLSDEAQNKILKRFSIKDEEELFVSIGQGDISVNRVLQTLVDDEQKQKEGKRTPKKKAYQKKEGGIPVVIAGASGLRMHIAKCCNPQKPEDIAAYITIDKGASIHKVSCPNIHRVKTSEKVLPAYWTSGGKSKVATLEIYVANRVGMLQDISRVIADLGINILSISAGGKKQKKNPGGEVIIKSTIEIENLNQLKDLLEKLNKIDGVNEVKRKG